MKRSAVIASLLAGSLLVSACGKSEEADDKNDTGAGTGEASNDDVVKVAWILPGPINDGGWSQAHNVAAEKMADHFGDKVEITYKESIADGDGAQVVEDLVKDGYDLIFGASFGFGEGLKAAAEKYPEVHFAWATGDAPTDNMSVYFGAGEDSLYLTGMAAGAETETNKIGFVAPFPIPEVIRHINAYTLGAQSVNPDATVEVVWTNAWFDPETERKAAESLIANGADVIANGGDGPAPGDVAKEKGVAWTGYDSDQSENYAEVWLTAAIYDWSMYYIEQVQAVMDGTWEAGEYYGSIADGFTDIATFGERVDDETRAAIEAKRQEFIDGTFNEFTGPILDQDGNVAVADGQTLTHVEEMTMMWFVQGVIGEIPAS